ncbi:MAG: hypothetical protein JXR37_00020 [Kiritimatiellae bacterium]|nr:hypothetical protein [Kiritimatiellia bacterium]
MAKLALMGSSGLCVALLCGGVAVAGVTTQTVTTVDDVVDGGDGLLSLREAVTTANVGSGDYVILLSGPSVYSLTGAGDDVNATGDLDIHASGRRVTLRGTGSTPPSVRTLSGGDRLLHVHEGTLAGEDLRLEYGCAQDDGDGGPFGLGGAVLVEGTNGATAELERCVLSGNQAKGVHAFGGAITVKAGGTLLAEDCALTNNAAVGARGADGGLGADGEPGGWAYGGALCLFGEAQADLLRCRLEKNAARGGRGGDGGEGASTIGGGEGGDGADGGRAFGAAVCIQAQAEFRASACEFVSNTATAGNGGDGGDGTGGLWGGRLGGDGGDGGDVLGTGRGYYPANPCTCWVGARAASNVNQAGHGGSGGIGGPAGTDGMVYLSPMTIIASSVHESSAEDGSVDTYLAGVRLDLCDESMASLCFDESRSSAQGGANAWFAHNMPTATLYVAADLPYGYRFGEQPPSDVDRTGCSAELVGDASLAVPLYGVPIYTSPTGSNRYPHCDWTSAAPSLDVGLAAATPGSTVLLAEGTWTLSGETIISGAVTVRGQNGAAATVVTGNGAERCFTLNHGNAALDGLTISNGYATTAGGGVFMASGGSVRNCRFVGNSAGTYGGGVFANGGQVTNCSFAQNTADSDGGGLFLYAGGKATHCRFAGNTAGECGGNVCCLASPLLNCLITDGTAAERGGGVYGDSAASIFSCTVYSNQAAVGEGGIYAGLGSYVVNTIAWGNTAPTNANWGPDPGATYLNACTVPPVGTACVSADPQFLDESSADYRLVYDSPCVNVGGNQSWMSGATDLGGRPRIASGIVDIGAYENTTFSIVASHEGNGSLSPSGTLSAPEGTNVAFTIVPDADHFAAVTVDGNAIDATNLYTFHAVGEDHTFTASFYAHAHVCPDGTAVSPYINWSTAANDIQSAVNVATHPSAMVLVSNGTYVLDTTIVVTNGTTVRGVNGAAHTIVDGNSTGRCFYVDHPSAVVEGFTLTNGFVTGEVDTGEGGGGGACIYAGGTVRDCTIQGNTAAGGGGAYCYSGGVFSNCVITGNSAGCSGGAHCENGGSLLDCVINDNSAEAVGGVTLMEDALARNLTVSGNVATTYYGGLLASVGSRVEACRIIGNSADAMVGGVALNDGATLENSVVACNTCLDDCGGVLVLSEVYATVQNCTIVLNAGQDTGGIHARNGARIYNTVAYYNTNTVATSNHNWLVVNSPVFACSCTLPSVGDGCTTNGPEFADLTSLDLRPKSWSPCVDAGLAIGLLDRDIDGLPRPLDGDQDGLAIADIGAHEHPAAGMDADGDHMDDGWEIDGGLDTTLDDSAGNPDGDACSNIEEFRADTDPGDSNSLLRITGLASGPDGLILQWQGGCRSRQYVERCTNALGISESWTAFRTNYPPLTLTNSATDVDAVEWRGYYRVRAER